MLLREMFSAIGAPKEDLEQEIDWIGDLKFFIDNDNDMLNSNFFPAVKKHEKYIGHPQAYKIYMKPIERCLESYCNKFEIEEPESKFPKESLIELAKTIASEQEKFISQGDYKKDEDQRIV